MEEWRAIKGYEGLYEVSNLGNVKSLARKDSLGRQVKEKILKTPADSYGYYQCGLYLEGKVRKFFIHNLVAITFLGHKPNGNNIVVDHINNVKTDNRLENLQLISHRENLSKDKKGYSSKYIGVTWHKSANKWVSHIGIDGRLKYLGLFINELEASRAYQYALKELV